MHASMKQNKTIFVLLDACQYEAGTKNLGYFAANFIGHYNILRANEMHQASGVQSASEFVAVRPEAIHISPDIQDGGGREVQMKGKITGAMSRGTTVVYTVDCSGLEINADVLFQPQRNMQPGDVVYLSVSKKDILDLQ